MSPFPFENILRQGLAFDIFSAASLGYNSYVVAILEANPGMIDVQNADGWTPLMLAAQFSHPDTVRLLLKRGSDVNLTNHDEENALIVSVKSNNLQVVELITQTSTKLDLCEKNRGWSAICYAARNGNLEILLLLARKGANIHILSRDEFNPLMIASLYGEETIVREILKLGGVIYQKSQKGETAISIAHANNNLQVSRLLEFWITLDNASNFIQDSQNDLAISSLEDAFEKLKINPKLYNVSEKDTVTMKYLYGRLLCASNVYGDVFKGLHTFLDIQTSYCFPAASFGMGLCYKKFFMFKEAVTCLRNMTDEFPEDNVFFWPGKVNYTIDELKPSNLMAAKEDLIIQCLHPPAPDVLCRYEHCLFSKAMFYHHLEYSGFCSIYCTEQYVVPMHPECFKSLGKLKKLKSKYLCGTICITPDCEGTIFKIKKTPKVGMPKFESTLCEKMDVSSAEEKGYHQKEEFKKHANRPDQNKQIMSMTEKIKSLCEEKEDLLKRAINAEELFLQNKKILSTQIIHSQIIETERRNYLAVDITSNMTTLKTETENHLKWLTETLKHFTTEINRQIEEVKSGIPLSTLNSVDLPPLGDIPNVPEKNVRAIEYLLVSANNSSSASSLEKVKDISEEHLPC